MKNNNHGVYKVNVNGCERDLKLFEVSAGVKIAVLNILGDTELVVAAASGLAKKLQSIEYDVLVTAEAKSIPLAFQLSIDLGKPYIVLRKNYKSYMGEALSQKTHSITTGKEQALYLDEKDKKMLTGSKVILLDDVISTGSTLRAMDELMEMVGAKVVANSAIFTEGEAKNIDNIVCLGHLPIFVD